MTTLVTPGDKLVSLETTTQQLIDGPSSSSLLLSKSTSTTLAERRRIPMNPEKLNIMANNNTEILKRLEQENAKLPTQVKKIKKNNELLLSWI